ncbi:hypothetical protein N7466_002524 [Penicillium verhagenii]|uniref:uncharacterized protein n=1 Tax=Penicillium verhagenii TaxID=1562060 RepID=UPI00254526A6|nr:uncharacterized protein N7466_002524 [Penicillium verhagenii]KAJ5939390.1 hypothetical protein N7466_002524 [Penicillium verhagenii]
MTNPPNPPRKRAPSPQNHKLFDAWNSASTGHQKHKAAYAGTATWRDTRSLKLERQLGTGDCLRPEDHVPSSRSRAFDGTYGSDQEDGEKKDTLNGAGEWRWVSDMEAKRSQLGVRDIRSFMGSSGKRKLDSDYEARLAAKKMKGDDANAAVRATSTGDGKKEVEGAAAARRDSESLRLSSGPGALSVSGPTAATLKSSNIFLGTTVFINGSTLPLISDHRLKRLLVDHGAQISIHMARKTVSHVIVGQPNAVSNATALGAGGGLSARKLQQEISRGGWKGVRIVGVEWVLESIKVGKRLSESRFGVLNVAPKGQQSVAGMFGRR